MEKFLNKFEHKFTYGDWVINGHGKYGVIVAMSIYSCNHFKPDAYMISYAIDPNPNYESDDEFWESEVNLNKYYK